MDARSFTVLELDRVLQRVAAATSFSGGRALVEALTPAIDDQEVAARQALTSEAIALLSTTPPRLRGAHDVRPAIDRAARRGQLLPDVLAPIAETCRAALDCARLVGGARATAPILARRLEAVEPALAGLAERIERAIEPDGSGVLDAATPVLAALRREIHEARQRATERLREMAASRELAEHLQESFVTERAGRPVLAVRASSRGAVPGIVHDTSGSGQTLFVEPLVMIEQQNRLREALAAERDEIDRILTELTAVVRSYGHLVTSAVDALADLDLALALGTVSAAWSGCVVTRGRAIELEAMRHPLLAAESVVPVDIRLGELDGVVVSGPNTGGKTVSMKALGLAALLHQCGLRPPARSARLPVFDAVLVDIGDEQSIERSLSTFSGHVANLVAILRRAGPGSLVLIDEVAAGTDPVEGAALARAVLEGILARGARFLVTTHYAELKEWAAATTGVDNAAVGFDPETLAPTYAFTVGRLGASHAFEIADRLGLPADVIEGARGYLDPGRRRVEELLREAAIAERDAARAREAAEALRAEAEALRRQAARRERELAEAVEAVRAGGQSERARVRAESEAQLARFRREIEALRGEIRAAQRNERQRQDAGRQAGAAADRALRERDRSLDQAARRRGAAEEALAEAFRDEREPDRPFLVGDPVLAPSLGLRGTIASISGGNAEVHGGTLRVRVPLTSLEHDPSGRATTSKRDVAVRAAPPQVEAELDVRGQRADEAREAVRAYVDDAALTGVRQVRVIHGRGTGAVRKAVREELRRHPLVHDTMPESMDGATLVRFAGEEPGA